MSASLIDNIHVKLVSKDSSILSSLTERGLAHSWTEDPGGGLSKAINAGILALPAEIKLVSWLGDDDRLSKSGTEKSLSVISCDESIVATYGICKFITELGIEFFSTTSRQEATSTLLFGPNRVPQPGSIFRREIFYELGMLDEKLGYSFDLDLFIRLTKKGTVKFVPEQVAFFRWHSDSLSSGGRIQSEKEAREVRKRYLPRHYGFVSWLWELPMYLSTKLIPNRLDRLANKKHLQIVDKPSALD